MGTNQEDGSAQASPRPGLSSGRSGRIFAHRPVRTYKLVSDRVTEKTRLLSQNHHGYKETQSDLIIQSSPVRDFRTCWRKAPCSVSLSCRSGPRWLRSVGQRWLVGPKGDRKGLGSTQPPSLVPPRSSSSLVTETYGIRVGRPLSGFRSSAALSPTPPSLGPHVP